VGGGLYRHDQSTAGPFAPPPDGAATALVGIADYSDLRYRVFSEVGRRLTARAEWAPAGSGDYAYRQFFAHAADYRAIGDRDHQSLHLIAEGGFREDGPRSRNAFFLGGSSRLRGYPSQYLGGERFYRLSAEYLRPLRWDWLRLLAVVELGGTGDDVERRSPGGVHGSVGLGLRIRLSRFVDAEVEFGIAWPLRGGDGPQVFAGGL
jgi:outer membrane protein assembly factor BamA